MQPRLLLRLTAAVACFVAACAQSDGNATKCGECCSPGGSCQAAFKNTPGLCCGVLAQRPFCCPTAASSFGAATCLQEGEEYRCRSSRSQAPRFPRPGERTTNHATSNSSTNWWWLLWLVIIPVVLLSLCIYSCINAARRKSNNASNLPVVQPSGVALGTMPPQAAYGYPAGAQPVYASNPMYGSAQQQGGVSPYLAGGAGLLGGYMLGSALGERHHGYGDSYYATQAWDGVGGDIGGGDSGGGTFAADS